MNGSPSATQRPRSLRAPIAALAFACTAAAAFAFSPAPLAQDKEKDTVQLREGKPESGKIESETYAGVTLGTKLIPWSNVQSINYAEGTDYTAAMQSLSSGKLQEALGEFEAIKSAAKVRPVLRQHALFEIAQLQQRLGADNPDEAIAAYRELLTAFPEGRYLRAAGDGLVACLVAKKDMAGATAALDKIGEGAKGVEAFKPELAVMRGQLLEVSKKTAEAKAAYDSAASAPGAVGQEAQIGLARCLGLDGKAADAESAARKLTTADAPNYILAGAWNAIGDVWSEQGRSSKDTEALLSALFCYMRGVVQYAPLPGEPSIEFERALAGSGRAFKYLAQLQQNPTRKKEYEASSRARLDQLKRDYPSSLFLER